MKEAGVEKMQRGAQGESPMPGRWGGTRGPRALCRGTGRQQRSILKCGGRMEIFGQVENMQLTRGFQQGSWEVRGLWCVAAVELRVRCNSKDPGKKTEETRTWWELELSEKSEGS